MSDRDKILMHICIGAGMMFLGLLVIFFTDGFDLPWFINIIGFLFAIAGAIYSFKTVRCPHCKEFLITRHGIPHHCPYCGKEIN